MTDSARYDEPGNVYESEKTGRKSNERQSNQDTGTNKRRNEEENAIVERRRENPPNDRRQVSSVSHSKQQVKNVPEKKTNRQDNYDYQVIQVYSYMPKFNFVI